MKLKLILILSALSLTAHAEPTLFDRVHEAMSDRSDLCLDSLENETEACVTGDAPRTNDGAMAIRLYAERVARCAQDAAMGRF